MRLIVKQTECAGKMFWIVRDSDSTSWFYHGPFADEVAAHAFARPKNSADWKVLLRAARMSKGTQRAALAIEGGVYRGMKSQRRPSLEAAPALP